MSKLYNYILIWDTSRKIYLLLCETTDQESVVLYDKYMLARITPTFWYSGNVASPEGFGSLPHECC